MVDSGARARARRRRSWLPSLAVVLGAVLVAGACGGDDSASGGKAGSSQGSDNTRSGYTVNPPPSVKAVVLPRADGSGDVAMPAPPGGLRLVYFGYTACPDVCPTTMSDIRRALATLSPAQRKKVAVDMVSIDPARDTAPRLTDYVHHFVTDGGALRTDDQTLLRNSASAFGAQYKVTTNEKGEVEVSHSAEIYGVDDKGTIVMQWPFGTSYKALAKDMKSLLSESNNNA